MMLLVDEPGRRRLFVNDMRGLLYAVSYDGRTVTPYLDLTAPDWGLSVQASSNERGFQSFAFHPQFNQPGTPAFGKFYTYADTSNTAPTPDFVPGGGNDAQDTVLLEWTAGDPNAPTYDGGPPRELVRAAAAATHSISRRTSTRSSARSSGSTHWAPTPPTASTASPPTTRSPTTATPTRLPRSMLWACAIPNASAGTRRPGTCSSPISARTSWKSSVS